MNEETFKLILEPDHPDFLDLPWHLPLSQWQGACPRLEEVNRGLSRHPVVFVNYDGHLYALKELPASIAEREYNNLKAISALRLPTVAPVGFALTRLSGNPASVLITCYLENSIPYRSLFMMPSLARYSEHLLDAIAGLLVQLHLAGIFWGDCSLSNTLFRRDAGALQAYLVDAETSEIYPQGLPSHLRHQELEIMEENINGELSDLEATAQLSSSVPLRDTGGYIRLRYLRLWEEITREVLINPDEKYRIHERVRALNNLGYSVGKISLVKTDVGDQLRLRVLVSDRNFHRDQLYSLTGLETQEMQARILMNEIQELKATLSQQNNRSTPLSVAAHRWLEEYYKPTLARLSSLIRSPEDAAELYCQLLEHKWYLSEKAQRDVGHQAAADDFLKRFGEPT